MFNRLIASINNRKIQEKLKTGEKLTINSLFKKAKDINLFKVCLSDGKELIVDGKSLALWIEAYKVFFKNGSEVKLSTVVSCKLNGGYTTYLACYNSDDLEEKYCGIELYKRLK